MKLDIENDDEVVRRLALKSLSRWEAEIAVRLIRGDDRMLPLRNYPLTIRDFVNSHTNQNQERNSTYGQ